MAQSDRQGTGRHPHKSTEEPFPHTKDDRNDGEHRSRSASHATHSGSERSSHSRDGESHRGSQGSHQSGASHSQDRGSSDTDLKQREYRDDQGEVHHHTRTYMEQHKGERDRK